MKQEIQYLFLRMEHIANYLAHYENILLVQALSVLPVPAKKFSWPLFQKLIPLFVQAVLFLDFP